MAETIKILGIYAPAPDTYPTLYTVPALKSAVVSSITICNTNPFDVKVRFHVIPSGSGTSQDNAVYYDMTIPANDTFAATLGLTLATGDFLTVSATASHVVFMAFGTELL